MITLGEELPSLPPLMARHLFFNIQISEQLSCCEKQSCPETFHSLCWNIFYLSGLLSNLWLALKNRVCPEFTVLNIIQNFEQLAHALQTRVCPEILHCIEIFLSFRIFEELALALITEFVMKFFAVFNIPFAFRMFEQLLLALKNRVCPEFTVLNVFSILQNFQQLALALKNRVCLENVHCIEIRIFE